ncbi:MAG: SDR family oxidoreductase [Pseudomonadota bacterium]
MPVKLKPLKRQVIVLTGATSGIGLATADAAAQLGAKLVLVARSTEALAKITEEINAGGGNAIYVAADVSDLSQVQNVAQKAVEHFGRIDTWINDAGTSIYGRLDEVSDADSRRLFDVNFWGLVNGSLVALSHLKTKGGALINVGSEASEAVLPLQGMYSATKHAVKGFTEALRVEIEEVDKAPVAITLIQPTAVNTPLPQHARNYMNKEPKLVTPQIDPYRVADAILNAAVRHSGNVKVGTVAKVDTKMHALVPGLSKKLEAQQINRQQYDEAPRKPEGTLYHSGAGGQVYGGKLHTLH